MRDFTKPAKEVLNTDKTPASDGVVPNEYGGIYDKPKPRKQGFIEARMNKDNFWNLMFWVGMTFGLWSTLQFDEKYSIAAFICSWSTILGVPYLVKRNSRTTFDKERGFFNSKGKSLEGSYPKAFGLMIFIAIGVVALLGLIMDKDMPNLSDSISNFLILSTFFGVITLYFILINCPISILFNKHIWCSKVPGVEGYELHQINSKFLSSSSHTSGLSPRSWSTDPGYKHLSSNIHHRR